MNAPFDFGDLQTTTRDWKADCPNGRGFLPVGRDPYGNEYCLKVSRKLFVVFGGGRKKTGVVGLRDRETGEIWKIADSFAAFLDNIYQSDGEETSPVCRIVEEGRVDGLKERLAQNAVDFAETSRNGLPLLTLAARRRQPEICRLLIEAGCDVDQKNADGKTALHFATSVDVINLLIDAGADVEARSNDGATPLEGWVKFLHQRPAIELIKRGARFDGLDAERLALNPYVARFIESLR